MIFLAKTKAAKGKDWSLSTVTKWQRRQEESSRRQRLERNESNEVAIFYIGRSRASNRPQDKFFLFYLAPSGRNILAQGKQSAALGNISNKTEPCRGDILSLTLTPGFLSVILGYINPPLCGYCREREIPFFKSPSTYPFLYKNFS